MLAFEPGGNPAALRKEEIFLLCRCWRVCALSAALICISRRQPFAGICARNRSEDRQRPCQSFPRAPAPSSSLTHRRPWILRRRLRSNIWRRRASAHLRTEPETMPSLSGTAAAAAPARKRPHQPPPPPAASPLVARAHASESSGWSDGPPPPAVPRFGDSGSSGGTGDDGASGWGPARQHGGGGGGGYTRDVSPPLALAPEFPVAVRVDSPLFVMAVRHNVLPSLHTASTRVEDIMMARARHSFPPGVLALHMHRCCLLRRHPPRPAVGVPFSPVVPTLPAARRR